MVRKQLKLKNHPAAALGDGRLLNERKQLEAFVTAVPTKGSLCV